LVIFEDDLLRQILRLHERLSRILETPSFSQPSYEKQGTRWEPRADVIKSAVDFAIAIELPGTPKESIRLEAEGGRLILTGERPPRNLPLNGRFRRLEGFYGQFRRVFPLPPGADASRIEASLGQGVLEVRVPLGKGKSGTTRRVRIK
jgi:HSP20 family protein